jgi:hypothetical protein
MESSTRVSSDQFLSIQELVSLGADSCPDEIQEKAVELNLQAAKHVKKSKSISDEALDNMRRSSEDSLLAKNKRKARVLLKLAADNLKTDFHRDFHKQAAPHVKQFYARKVWSFLVMILLMIGLKDEHFEQDLRQGFPELGVTRCSGEFGDRMFECNTGLMEYLQRVEDVNDRTACIPPIRAPFDPSQFSQPMGDESDLLSAWEDFKKYWDKNPTHFIEVDGPSHDLPMIAAFTLKQPGYKIDGLGLRVLFSKLRQIFNYKWINKSHMLPALEKLELPSVTDIMSMIAKCLSKTKSTFHDLTSKSAIAADIVAEQVRKHYAQAKESFDPRHFSHDDHEYEPFVPFLGKLDFSKYYYQLATLSRLNTHRIWSQTEKKWRYFKTCLALMGSLHSVVNAVRLSVQLARVACIFLKVVCVIYIDDSIIVSRSSNCLKSDLALMNLFYALVGLTASASKQESHVIQEAIMVLGIEVKLILAQEMLQLMVPEDKVTLATLAIIDVINGIDSLLTGVVKTHPAVTPKALEKLLGVVNFIACLARFKWGFGYLNPVYAMAYLTDEDFVKFIKPKKRKQIMRLCLLKTLEMITNIEPIQLSAERLNWSVYHVYTDAALEKNRPSLGGVDPKTDAFRVAHPTVFYKALCGHWLSITFFEAIAVVLMLLNLVKKDLVSNRRIIVHVDNLGAIWILSKGTCSTNPALQAVAQIFAEVTKKYNIFVRLAYIWTKRNTGDLVTREDRMKVLQDAFQIPCNELVMSKDFPGVLERLRTLTNELEQVKKECLPPQDMKDRHFAKRMKLAKNTSA